MKLLTRIRHALPVIVTTGRQSAGAPLADHCYTSLKTVNDDGAVLRETKFEGRAILLTPWRRNEHGESRAQRTLVLGWRA